MSNEALDVSAQVDRLVAVFPKLRDGVGRVRQIADADPEMALTRNRKVLEIVVHDAYEREFDEKPGTKPLENLIQRLVKEERLPKRIAAYAHMVRELGNVGTHGMHEDVTQTDVSRALGQLLPVLEWYAARYGAAAAEPANGSLSESMPRAGAAQDSLNAPAASEPRGASAPNPSSLWGQWPVRSVAIGLVAVSMIAAAGYFFSQPTSELPAWGRSLPAGQALHVAFDEAPASTGEAAGMRVGVFARRHGDSEFAALADGEHLTSDDDYLLLVNTATAGNLYVFQIDGAGSVSLLFPRTEGCRWSEGTNPVSTGATLQIPSAEHGQALFLDEAPGVERIYVALSAEPWPKLQAALAAAEGRGPAKASELSLAALATPGPLGPASRGIGGTRLIEQPSQALDARLGDQLFKLNLSGPLVQSKGSAAVVQRWFVHER